MAYCGLIYVRWKLVHGSWHTALGTSKARFTSSAVMTTPRSELSGMVLLVRLVDAVIKNIEVVPQCSNLISKLIFSPDKLVSSHLLRSKTTAHLLCASTKLNDFRSQVLLAPSIQDLSNC